MCQNADEQKLDEMKHSYVNTSASLLVSISFSKKRESLAIVSLISGYCMNVVEIHSLELDVTVSMYSFDVIDWINLCIKIMTTWSTLYNRPGSHSKRIVKKTWKFDLYNSIIYDTSVGAVLIINFILSFCCCYVSL